MIEDDYSQASVSPPLRSGPSMRKCNFKVVWEILVPPELVSEKTKYDNNCNNNSNNNDNNYHNNNYNNNYYDCSASIEQL